MKSSKKTGLGRREVLGGAVTVAAGALASPLLSQAASPFSEPNATGRPLTSAFPEKGRMILQRSRPPLLETPMEVFDRSVFTPNDQFFVRWHWGVFPTSVDVRHFRLRVRGHVQRELSISLEEILKMPRVEIAAVNQCSGNSRAFFQPRVPGAQWGHGAMGNARWMGVSLRHLLLLAGVRSGAVGVRFGGLDTPTSQTGPDFVKSLSIHHALDKDVMVAFLMNGEQLPLLNGFPLRLVVPGWYSTYWIKMLNDIELISSEDHNFWMAKAYRIPLASGAETVPISKMVPRSWITSLPQESAIAFSPRIPLRGIAMGGDSGVARVELSANGGRNWVEARLGADEGAYSFRQFEGEVPVTGRGAVALLSRCTNRAGVQQSLIPNWNPSGYMRGCVEATNLTLT